MNQSEINDAEWRDSGNWHWGVYNSPRDTRVWVPKQIKWTGWTLNFAHRIAYFYVTAALLPAVIALALITLEKLG